jgi:acyl-CoA synthetase (AMP-forming)/AMP-acid ligase II
MTDFELAHSYLGTPYGPPWRPGGTIVSRLTRWAHTQPSAPFVTAVSAGGELATVSYGEFDALTRRSASWLRTTLRVRPGEVLALVARNNLASLVAILGLLRTGGAVLLLPHSDPVGRWRQQVDALGATAILCAPDPGEEPDPGTIAAPEPAALPDRPIGAAEAWLDPASDALFFGTSGSTASAKLVAQSHHNAMVNADAVRRHHGLRAGERILGCLPVHHVNGLHFTFFGALHSGAHLMLAPAFDPFEYPQLLRRFQPRLASVVPSILEALLETWRKPALPTGFHYFVSAAAPLSAATARRLGQGMGARVLQGYGLTETTNFATAMPRDISDDLYRRLALEADIPSVGVPVPGNEVSILRPDGAPADPGEAGEICVRGRNVMTRYAGNPTETAAAFRFGWFHTQDIGYQIADRETGKRFVVITGRTKNIAKIAGETVSLEEMERLLCAVPQVRDAACVSVPNRLLGEEIVAVVVYASDDRPELYAYLRTAFALAALPSRIVRMDAIPRTATGKIRRPELAEQLAGRAEAEKAREGR